VTGPAAFLILADQAAAWRIAGLSQLDRIALALNEFAEACSPNEIIQAIIFWHPEIPASNRWLPRHPRITRVRLTEATKLMPAGTRLLHTRLVVQRNGLAEFLEAITPVYVDDAPEETSGSWNELSARFMSSIEAVPRALAKRPWRFIETPADISACDNEFLSRIGKSQDGIVSRFLNRPFSRIVSRYLLRVDLSPTRWTAILFVLPVAAFFCLSRGDYSGILAGAILFQLYSILDGCDGEIARATYQETERGGRIDDFLDMLGSLLFVVALGFGLFRTRSSIFLLEGVLCAAVIVVNEWLLRRVKVEDKPESPKLVEALYPRHRRLLAHPIFGLIGENAWWWIVQFTKRDTAILVCLILAALDWSQWILHLWLTVSAATLALSARSSAGQNRAV
jgi:hypothetical protein